MFTSALIMAIMSPTRVSYFELPHDKMTVRPAKTQISLIRVFACIQWVAKEPSFLHADIEDCDQTGRMQYHTEISGL